MAETVDRPAPLLRAIAGAMLSADPITHAIGVLALSEQGEPDSEVDDHAAAMMAMLDIDQAGQLCMRLAVATDDLSAAATQAIKRIGQVGTEAQRQREQHWSSIGRDARVEWMAKAWEIMGDDRAEADIIEAAKLWAWHAAQRIR